MTKKLAAYLVGLAVLLAGPWAFAGSATALRITSTATTTAAGNPVTIIVEAVDGTGTTDTAFTGTVYFGSSDDYALLPANYTFVAGDLGTRIFPSAVTLVSAGPQTIAAATLAPSAFITGTSTAITVNGGTATSLSVSGPSSASIGIAASVTVTARDAWGNLANLYSGTINVTSSDVAATLPAPAALTGGTGTRAVTFGTTGNQTVTVTDAANGSLTATTGAIAVASTPIVALNPATLAFGGQSMQTTAPAQTVTISNTGGGAATLTSISASSNYSVTHNCGATLNPGANCTATVSFTPTIEGTANGTLTIAGNAGTKTAALTGTGERSLVTHYYRSILRREPDSGGKTFWNGEATRLAALGANPNETWYAMAMSFFESSEYLGFGRTDTEFVGDLYNTFFNRPADSAGLNFWLTQMTGGMPRGVVLVEFLFSTEFTTFTNSIFGTTTVRPEIDTETDFYRGILSRLPDDSGFTFWLTKFRTAQCQGASAVTAQAEAISSQFALSSEYLGRNRTNAQYVGDLYNAFLRRGGDLTGVVFWIGQLDDGSLTREQVRQSFLASAEFSARVNAIIAAGTHPDVTCAPIGEDTDINGQLIPSPTAPAGSRMCEGGPGSALFPGAGPGPCGSYQIPIGNCSTNMSGVNAITKAWQYNLEDYQAGSARIGNNIWMALPRDNAMVFRFKTGAADAMGSLPTADPNLLRYMTIGYEEHTGLGRGPLAPRFVSISETRCDFDYTKLSAPNLNGCYVAMEGGSSLVGKIWANGTPTPPVNLGDYPYCALKPNTTYYMNIRYENAATSRGSISCNTATCGQAIGFN